MITTKGQMRRSIKGAAKAEKARTAKEVVKNQRIEKFFGETSTALDLSVLEQISLQATKAVALEESYDNSREMALENEAVDADKKLLAPLKFSGTPLMSKVKNAKLYEEILMAKEVSICGIDDKGGFITLEKVVSVSNSLFNRTMMSLAGTAEDGVVLEMLDDERNVAYTVVTGDRYKLLNDVIKIHISNSFLNDRTIDSVFKEDVINSIKTGSIAYNESTKKLTIGGKKRKDGEKMFIAASWSPSSLKGYSLLMYDFGKDTLTENEAVASAFHNVLSNNGIGKEVGRKTDFKKAEARVTSFDSVNGIKIDHPLYSKDGDIEHGGVLFLRNPLNSVSEVFRNKDAEEALKAGLEFKTNASDGQMLLSSAWTAKAGNQMAGKHLYSEKEARGVNIQLRTDYCFNKAFALSIARRSINNIANIIMNTLPDSDWCVLGNLGHINAICDSDCVKMLNFDSLKAGKNKPASLSAIILDIAHTSVGLNNSSQAYNKVCNTDMRDIVDACLIDKIYKESDAILDHADAYDVPFINVKDNLAQVACTVNKKMVNSTLSRKDALKQLDSMKNRIAKKASVSLDGFYGHITFDSINAITGGVVKNLLGLTEKGEIEFYSEFAERDSKKYGKGVMLKYPSQGTEEAPRCVLVSKSEMMNRARTQIASALFGKNRNIVMTIVNDFIDAIGDGTVLLPAINTMKDWVAGMDCDYDAVCIITEPFFVEAIDIKNDSKMAKGDLKEDDVLVGNACYISYLKDRNIDFTNKVNQKVLDIIASSSKMAEKEATNSIRDFFVKCKEEIEFGSVIGETVSKGDLATTLADEFLFDANSGKITFYGKAILTRLFVPIVREDKISPESTVEVGKRYQSIFKKDVNKFNIKIGTYANGNSGIVRFFLVNVDTVNEFIKELRNIDIRYVDKDDFKLMMFDFTNIVRALGESAIDMVKKGAEVDLGARMGDIVKDSVKKLSSTIKHVEASNLMEFIHWCVYNVPNNATIGANKYASNQFEIDLLNEDIIDFIDGKKSLPSLKSDDLVFIDKVGVLKVKMLRALMDSIQTVGNSFKVSDEYDWTKSILDKYRKILSKIDPVANSAAQKLRRPLYNVSSLLKACTNALYNRSLNKELKLAIRDSIICELRQFSSVLSIEDVVVLSIMAAFNYYYKPVHGSVKAMINDVQVKAAELKDPKKWDKAAELIFKVFGPLTALAFLENKDSLNVEIPVNHVFAGLSESEKLQINDIENIDFEEIDDSGIYQLFLKASGKVFGHFEMPKELKAFVSGITDIGYAYSEEKNCKVLFAKVVPSWSDFRSDYKIVTLDKVMDKEGRNICIASDFTTTKNTPLSGFNYVPDMEYVKEVIESVDRNVYIPNEKADFSNYNFIGKNIVKKNYHLGSSMLKEQEPVGGKFLLYVEDGDLSYAIGNHFSYEDISGKTEIAFKNVLILKR